MQVPPAMTAVVTAVLIMTSSALGEPAVAGEVAPSKRVPAEWEAQEAIWLQWPGPYEKAHETAFAKMAAVIIEYQKLHILHDTKTIRDQAHAAVAAAGADPDHENIVWQAIRNDSAWMRDNGPVYVVDDGEMRIQNWEFDAWGGAFGANVPYRRDNDVPAKVGEYLGMPVDHVDIAHERGNLEFNGVGALILNWSTIGDHNRNPGYTKARAEADLKRHFGLRKVVFIEGVPEGDRTKGHVDGIARFINPTTVVVPDCTAGSTCKPGDNGNDAIFDAAAATIEAAGFTVIRDPIEGVSRYKSYTFDTNYMNWIVGNGFLIVVGFDNPVTDAAAKARIEGYYPGRDVHVIEMLSSWASGGGAHCHTNDQPAMSTIEFSYPQTSGG